MEKDMVPYQPILSEIKELVLAGRTSAYRAANSAIILTYWNIGKRIVEQEQRGFERGGIREGIDSGPSTGVDPGIWQGLFCPEYPLLPKILPLFPRCRDFEHVRSKSKLVTFSRPASGGG